VNIFYVYLHRRLSDNKVFYVGKGKNKRAWSTYRRSSYWSNVVAKHGFKVEIVFDELSEADAFQIEKDTITEMKYFGSPLVNLTDGGEGTSGLKRTAESVTRMRKSLTGKKHSDQTKQKMSATHKLQGTCNDENVYCFYSKCGEVFIGTRGDLSKHTGLPRRKFNTLFGRCRVHTAKGWHVLDIQKLIILKELILWQ